jgi:hypothetical protein
VGKGCKERVFREGKKGSAEGGGGMPVIASALARNPWPWEPPSMVGKLIVELMMLCRSLIGSVGVVTVVCKSSRARWRRSNAVVIVAKSYSVGDLFYRHNPQCALSCTGYNCWQIVVVHTSWLFTLAWNEIEDAIERRDTIRLSRFNTLPVYHMGKKSRTPSGETQLVEMKQKISGSLENILFTLFPFLFFCSSSSSFVVFY